MIYYRQKISNFTEAFDKCSVIVLVGQNYKLLRKEAKKISDAIAGPEADDELRITRYFNKEINEKKHEIISSLRTKGFFSGRQIIFLNELSEKDCRIITEIDAEWQNDDAVTIITMDELSKNSDFKKSLASSARIALVTYTYNKVDGEFLISKLAEEGISFEGKEVLNALIDFAKFTPENILENELEKLKLFKLFDDKPLSINDFFDIVSVNYEIKELGLAVALAERNIIEIEKNLSTFFSQGKNPTSILQFISAYFYKLSLIKLYGPTSFEVRREYPFLINSDLEKSKIHVKRWSAEQINKVINYLTISDLKLRKYPSLFQRSILTQCLHKILEI